MTPMPRPPWSDAPILDWDEENEAHIARHGIRTWEVDEMIDSREYECRPHKKRREGGKYASRFVLVGSTLGGRLLEVIVDFTLPNTLRVVTAFLGN